MNRNIGLTILLTLLVAGCGEEKKPSAPSPPAPANRQLDKPADPNAPKTGGPSFN